MLKDSAKKGDKDSCRVLAKEVVRSNKAISRIHCAKAQLKSVENHMHQQLGKLAIFLWWLCWLPNWQSSKHLKYWTCRELQALGLLDVIWCIFYFYALLWCRLVNFDLTCFKYNSFRKNVTLFRIYTFFNTLYLSFLLRST